MTEREDTTGYLSSRHIAALDDVGAPRHLPKDSQEYLPGTLFTASTFPHFFGRWWGINLANRACRRSRPLTDWMQMLTALCPINFVALSQLHCARVKHKAVRNSGSPSEIKIG